MKCLSLDTSTEACSAALLVDGKVTERYEVAPRRHGELILGMVDGLLREAGVTLKDMDALAFGRGPGAFTGVRIAAGVVQGLAFGVNKPVVPVSSLAALAQGVATGRPADTLIMCAFDARMGEVYWGVYQVGADGLVVPVGEEQVAKPGAVQLPVGASAPKDGRDEPGPTGRFIGVGSGWHTYESELIEHCGGNLEVIRDCYPHARDVLLLAQRDFAAGLAVTAEEAQPVYLRNRVTG